MNKIRAKSGNYFSRCARGYVFNQINTFEAEKRKKNRVRSRFVRNRSYIAAWWKTAYSSSKILFVVNFPLSVFRKPVKKLN